MELRLLNGIRRRIILNTLKFRTKSMTRGWIILGTLGIFFFAADFGFFRRVLIYIKGLPMAVAELLIPQFLMVICLMFFSMLVFSNIIASISTLYLSRDLDLLISSPLKIRNIYMARFFHTMANSSWMFLIFGIPIFVALGWVWQAGPAYYLGMLLTIGPLIIIPAGTGVLVTTVLMRYFPARRTHQFLTVVGLIFMGGLIVFFRLMRPERLLGKKKIPLEVIQEYIETLKVPDYWFLPSTWAARALRSGSVGEYADMWLWTGVAWAGALVTAGICLYFGGGIYYRGWSAAYSGRSSSSFKPAVGFYRRVEKLLGFIGPAVRAILLKDMKVFFRDPSQWTQVFMLLALVIVYVFNIRNLPMETLILKNFVSVMNIALAGVVMAAVGVRFVFSTTSVEGKSFWLLKGGPVNFHRFLWGKFFFYLIPLLILSESLVVVSNMFLEVDLYLGAISILGIFFLTVGLTGLGVGLGAIYPVFEHENIAELATSTGAIYYMLISLVYIGVVVMFGVGPVWTHFSKKFLLKEVMVTDPTVYISYAVIVALTLLVTVIPIRKGAKALEQMEV